MKSKRKYSLLTGSIIVLLIISTPYFLYFYKSIPAEETEWNSIFGVIKSGEYPSVQVFVYYFSMKFVPLLLLFIWFVTNKHWWVHAIIIPISVYLFQLISILNQSEEYMDEVEFIYSLPITAVILVILYFIRSKIAVYIQAVDLKKEMDEQMKDIDKL